MHKMKSFLFPVFIVFLFAIISGANAFAQKIQPSRLMSEGVALLVVSGLAATGLLMLFRWLVEKIKQ